MVFKSTDRVDDCNVINTGASDRIGNDNVNYGAHQDVQNGPLVEFANGSSKQVTSTDILPIPFLPPETCIYNRIEGGKSLLSIQRA